jgi:hypothetical protein
MQGAESLKQVITYLAAPLCCNGITFSKPRRLPGRSAQGLGQIHFIISL